MNVLLLLTISFTIYCNQRILSKVNTDAIQSRHASIQLFQTTKHVPIMTQRCK